MAAVEKRRSRPLDHPSQFGPPLDIPSTSGPHVRQSCFPPRIQTFWQKSGNDMLHFLGWVHKKIARSVILKYGVSREKLKN